MNRIFRIIFFPIEIFLYILIYVYKILISPLKPKTCKFYPSCSTYMIQSIKEFGVYKGTKLGIKRILKCTPKNKSGVDLIPLNLKGETKWVY